MRSILGKGGFGANLVLFSGRLSVILGASRGEGKDRIPLPGARWLSFPLLKQHRKPAEASPSHCVKAR